MYQERAEELAWERHECDFYDLPEELQFAIYQEAERGVVDRLYDMADQMRKGEGL
jgi:hypothetical protein